MKVFKLAALTAMMSLAAGAQAGTVASQFFDGFQQLSDNSAEWLSGDLNTNRKLELGDTLQGIFTIETLEKTGFATRYLGGGSGNNELTGFFEGVVVGYQELVPATPGLADGVYKYLFAPTASFQATYGVGAMVAMFEDATPDYTRVNNATCTDLASCIATATNGSPFMTLGFATASDFWASTSFTNDIDVVGQTNAPLNGGVFNTGLSILANYSGLTFNKVGCGALGPVNVCGSGSLLGTEGVVTPFDSFDNVDFTVNVERVPEPATLGLLGLGLMGLGLARRRKA